MAQNITLLNSSYSAVPAVLLPKTGGGTAKFSDASITTAVESDVASGKKFLLADGSEGTGTASGGGGGTTVQTKTGTFTGNGTRTISIACDFEPDLVYVTSNPGTTASSGTVAFIIARGMMAATRYRNNTTSNSHYAVIDIANMNTSGSSYSWRATYVDGNVVLYCWSNSSRALLTNNRTYSYTFVKYTS